MTATWDAATGLWRPEGCALNLGMVLAVATRTNAAQAAMGTELLDLERHGATIGVAWRDDLAGGDDEGLATGVLAALLDHVCSIAALMSINDVDRCGPTMGLRVDFLAPAVRGRDVHVHARCVQRTPRVAHVQGRAFHPDEPNALLATGTCTMSAQP